MILLVPLRLEYQLPLVILFALIGRSPTMGLAIVCLSNYFYNFDLLMVFKLETVTIVVELHDKDVVMQ